MAKSNLGKLDLKDAAKGLIVAVISAIITALYELISTGGSILDISWQTVLSVAIIAALGYIGKNLGSNSDDKFLKKELKS